jgi:hypothetical protein
MPYPKRLILEDETTTYEIFVESTSPNQKSAGDYEAYSPNNPRSPNRPTVSEEMRVDLVKVRKTIEGYTQYAIGAFKSLAIAEVEEVTLKFNIKISAEAGLPMIASGKTESDFAIEVKCKFPKN